MEFADEFAGVSGAVVQASFKHELMLLTAVWGSFIAELAWC